MTYTEQDYQKMAEEYTAGTTLANLAFQFSVSIPTMSKYVKKGGAVVRSRGQRKKIKETLVTEVADMTPDPEVEAGVFHYEVPAPITRTIIPME